MDLTDGSTYSVSLRHSTSYLLPSQEELPFVSIYKEYPFFLIYCGPKFCFFHDSIRMFQCATQS